MAPVASILKSQIEAQTVPVPTRPYRDMHSNSMPGKAAVQPNQWCSRLTETSAGCGAVLSGRLEK